MIRYKLLPKQDSSNQEVFISDPAYSELRNTGGLNSTRNGGPFKGFFPFTSGFLMAKFFSI
jgi:hypothetical protein